MKQLLIVMALVATAHAQDFDGTWKVPDAQTLPKCSDQKTCLRLAWTAEAGIRTPGDDNAKRLGKALDYHTKACTFGKQKPCANAERVQKKLDAAKALKSDAEKTAFWCADALEGAARFEAGSKTAPTIVTSACGPLFPPKFKKGLDAIGGMGGDSKGELMLELAREELCPGLKTKPEACQRTKTTAKLSAAKITEMLGSIFKAALPADVASRADELAMWMMK